MEKLSQATVLLNSGHDIDVIPVQGSEEYLCRILGEMPAKPAVPTLCVLDGTSGDSFVAVYVGDQHVGYLPHPADPELIRILRDCSQRGAAARARGKLIASWEAQDQVKVRVSLAESHQLLGPPTTNVSPQTRRFQAPPSSADLAGNVDPQERRAWADAMPQSAKTARTGWLGADARTACAAETATPSSDGVPPTFTESQAPHHPSDPWHTRGEKRLDRDEGWVGR